MAGAKDEINLGQKGKNAALDLVTGALAIFNVCVFLAWIAHRFGTGQQKK